MFSWRAQAAGTWVPLKNLAPDLIDTMLLLSDGTVMAASGEPYAGGIGNAWYRLTPDTNGSYINGTWTAMSPMNDTRLYYSSQVLRDGRVLVAGGEYGTGSNTAEIYDPAANTWTLTPPPVSGQTAFSDSSSEILPNGDVLVSPVGPAAYGETTIYTVASGVWTVGPILANNNFYQDEAAWVKLPDNSILSIDPFGTNSERYIPSLNQWISDANVPVEIYGNYEMGGAILLPNGKAFFPGGTGNTALYTPSGNTSPGVWEVGPVIPDNQAAADAPMAMMVNGKVLCIVSPITNSSPASFYEYDPEANAFAQIDGPNGPTLGQSAYAMRFLDLPDGTVLFSASGSQLYVYQPDGSPLAAGKPAIATLTTNSDGSYHLIGTLFNGISEGASYGDDVQMNSDYPLVRLTNSAGCVFYARTFNWSGTSVMTGTNIESTEFTLPANLPVGIYSLVVVANGIASDPIPFVYAPDALLVTAGATPIISGTSGGPFTTNAIAFTLTNVGAATLNWSAGTDANWLNLLPPSGTLTPGGAAATMTATLNSAASNFAFGTYTADIFITNTADHFIQTRQLTLNVLPPQLVQNGGFETGDFTDWTLNGYGYNYNYVTNGLDFTEIQPHSGNYEALLGQIGSLGTLTQNLATTPGQSYLLSVWMDSPDGGGYNEFSVSWDGNILFDGANLPALGWTNLQFIVTASSSSTALQFGFEDEATWLGMDDISVTAINLPSLKAPTTSNGSVNLSWTTMMGLAYQLQFKTNLTQSVWINLGNPITASGGTLTTIDVSPADQQRFYQLQVLP